MQQEVYADLLFLINFSMDYLCLYICAKVLHKRLRLGRMLLASALGGIYSITSLLLYLSATRELILDAFVCLIICLIAFYEKRQRIATTILCCFLYIGISMMTGGCMTAIFNILNRFDLPLGDIDADSISTYLFAIVAAAAGFISFKSNSIISHRSSISECNLEISYDGRCEIFKGFCDSGNLIKDPMTGKAVIVVDRTELQLLIDVSCFDSYSKGVKTKIAIHIIPINTAGGRSLLLAFHPDKILLEYTDKRNKAITVEIDALIAPSDIKSSNKGYSAIVPQFLFKQQ